MTDDERQTAWIRLKTEEADLLEQLAVLPHSDTLSSIVCPEAMRLANVRQRLNNLRDARAIRDMLAKIEAL